MRLNDPLISSVIFKEFTYPLDMAFDNILDVLDVLNSNFYMGDKVNSALELLIGENDLYIDEKMDLLSIILNEYININVGELETDRLGNPLPNQDTSKKLIDLEKDAKYIYSSFRQMGINLFEEQGKLSWEEFQALLSSLPDDTIMSKIIEIRTYEPKKGEDAKYREKMRKLQNKYSLEED